MRSISASHADDLRFQARLFAGVGAGLLAQAEICGASSSSAHPAHQRAASRSSRRRSAAESLDSLGRWDLRSTGSVAACRERMHRHRPHHRSIDQLWPRFVDRRGPWGIEISEIRSKPSAVDGSPLAYRTLTLWYVALYVADDPSRRRAAKSTWSYNI